MLLSIVSCLSKGTLGEYPCEVLKGHWKIPPHLSKPKLELEEPRLHLPLVFQIDAGKGTCLMKSEVSNY